MIESQDIFFGRLLNDIDHNSRRKVCNIGKKVCDELFKGQDPCGKFIRVNGLYYQVVGVIKGKASGLNLGGRSEESIYLPFSTMQQTLNQGDILHLLCFSAYAGQSVEPIIEDVRKILSAQNEIAPNDPQAIQFVNIAKQFETFNMLFIGIDFLVWLVGMGTLLAGVIGISNIMMVTVKERTKEIGVRRALGAKPYNIISQVMSESLALTAMAGLLGLSFGVFILDIINKAMSTQEVTRETFFINPGVDIDTAVYASIVLLISGMVAGLIPAWRAMQIKAIDAIREE